jgi:hypothetical protein
VTLELFDNSPNPFCIVPEVKLMEFPNMIDRFENDLYGIAEKVTKAQGNLKFHHLTKMITMYYFDLLIEFKDNFKGVIPINYANDIYYQVMEAFINLFGDFLNISQSIPNYIRDGFVDMNIFDEVSEYMNSL